MSASLRPLPATFFRGSTPTIARRLLGTLLVHDSPRGRTVARMDPLAGDARVGELARMLAGDRATETTRRQAREVISRAREPLRDRPERLRAGRHVEPAVRVLSVRKLIALREKRLARLR